ncbi:Anoctamin-4-like [Tropilaelaps mercedesae]|uniref:Anoctamin n=1 Tax=Tropilaelaps mercedesae TaxID=418985 RepID=A0A1V9X5Z2_9ACAR|nr:Anoctamin-4-like [Tropilaelaps mercedesae]
MEVVVDSGASAASDDPPVDIILVYDQFQSKQCKRERFLEKLTTTGFDCRVYKGRQRNLRFVAITTPLKALCKEAKKMHMQVPISLRTAGTWTELANCPQRDTAILITWNLLQKVRSLGCQECDDCRQDQPEVGIEGLIDKHVFIEAFQLHEGDWSDPRSPRGRLYARWACQWTSPQPLQDVKEYFGEKISLYFAWLGFYTFMLCPLALLGVGVFVYDLLHMYQDERLKDVCFRMFHVVLCPLADDTGTPDVRTAGRFSLLGEWCHHAIACALFDNSLTLPWSLFTLLWAFVFRAAWRRYEHRQRNGGRDQGTNLSRISEITDSSDYDEVLFFSTTKLSSARSFFTYGAVTLMSCLVVVVISTICAYRIPLRAALQFGVSHQTYGPLLALGAASMVNVLAVWLLNYVFRSVAVWLTRLERPRTSTEFENKLTVKLYLIHFASCYSSLVYIAFFEEKSSDDGSHPCPDWAKEHTRPLLYAPTLFLEYLELETQYGYIVMFGLVFPLAPLLALLNNVVEIRLDAQKFLCLYRRPTSSRAAHIGAWYKITGAINRLAVLSNAFVLAFCSDLIPRLYHAAIYEQLQQTGSTSVGFVDFSLAYIDTLVVNHNASSPWPEAYRPSTLHQRFCRYPQLRENPWYNPKRGLSGVASDKFWIFICRLLFVFVFEVEYVVAG